MAKLRILVVDDDEHMRFTLNRWFQAAGYEVDVAADGLIAVEKCEAAHYDAVTMDLEMPRMNGADATGKIKEMSPGTPILVLTGFSDHVQAAIDNGADKVMRKPISLGELQEELQELINATA
jgi:CheY-like chemotaxis protein